MGIPGLRFRALAVHQLLAIHRDADLESLHSVSRGESRGAQPHPRVTRLQRD